MGKIPTRPRNSPSYQLVSICRMMFTASPFLNDSSLQHAHVFTELMRRGGKAATLKEARRKKHTRRETREQKNKNKTNMAAKEISFSHAHV